MRAKIPQGERRARGLGLSSRLAVSEPRAPPGALACTERRAILSKRSGMTEQDAELVAQLLAGEPTAIRTVRDWIGGALTRYRGRLGNELEDIEQDVVLQLMEALADGRFRAESRLQTYVFSYARFKCIDRLRALGRRDMVELDEEVVRESPLAPTDEWAGREAQDLARRVVEALPAGCREAWEMIAKGLSYKEMSAALGVGEGALRVRVHRCRQRALEIRRRLLAGEPL